MTTFLIPASKQVVSFNIYLPFRSLFPASGLWPFRYLEDVFLITMNYYRSGLFIFGFYSTSIFQILFRNE